MKRSVFTIFFGAMLAACQPASDAPSQPTPSPAPSGTPEPKPAAAAQSMSSGKYCYFAKNETSTEGFQLTITEAETASAQYFGTIHNDASAYYAAFETQLSNGKLDAKGKATFSSVTEVDGDTQTGQETWVFTPDQAHSNDGRVKLSKAPCATLLDSVWPQVE